MTIKVVEAEPLSNSTLFTGGETDLATNKGILIHEQQLNGELGKSIHNGRQSDFSLMLAMLTQNVREHSQFFLPQSDKIQFLTEDGLSGESLRKVFELPKERALSLKNLQQISTFNQAEIVNNNNLSDIHLLEAIAPKPLAFRNDKKHLNYDVVKNTSLYCQTKLKQLDVTEKQNSDEVVLNKKLTINVQGWLNAIQNSIVKSSMITAA